MKRQLAFVLAAWIGLQQPLGTLEAYAAQPLAAGVAGSSQSEWLPVSSPSNGQEEETETLPEATPDAPLENPYRGNVIVEIRTVLPVEGEIPFEVHLTEKPSKLAKFLRQEAEVNEYGQFTVQPGEMSEIGKGVFQSNYVPDGTYVLTVNAEGYEPYKQEIKIKGDTCKVMLFNDYYDEEQYTSSAHPGLIRMGDVNGDDIIDDEDLEELLDAIHAEELGVNAMDFNQDGELNLSDLQYFASFYDYDSSSRKHISTVERSVTRKEGEVKFDDTASPSDAVEIDGKPEALFDHDSEESSVTVARKDGEKISEENPVELTLDFTHSETELKAEGFVIQSPSGSENAITSGEIEVTVDDDGKEKKETLTIVKAGEARKARFGRSGGTAEIQPDGSIVVNLKSQKPVKKVTIRVTGTVSQGSLAEISQVEFMEDMKDRIPPPVQNIPKNLQAEIGSAEFTLIWDKENNVTGYEISISHDGETETMASEENSVTINSFGGKKLLNYETYRVRVRSVNGTWKSNYSSELSVTPEPSGPPPAPEYIKIDGFYRCLNVSWKKMKDTQSYTLFYRQKGTEEFTAVENIDRSQTSLTLEHLADNTEYEVYMVGHNPLGDSPDSTMYSGRTAPAATAKMPAYGLLNDGPDKGKDVTNHIKKVENIEGANYNRADEEIAIPTVIVDGDPTSYWLLEDWDSGVHYGSRGPIITLDQPYEMDTIRFTAGPAQKSDLSAIKVLAWETEDGSGSGKEIPGRFSRLASMDNNGSVYYEFIASEPFTAKKVQINLSASGNVRYISIGEIRFYEYNSLLNDIDALFTDALHVALKAEVTMDDVKALKERANELDPASGETHPKKELALKDLSVAESILLTGVSQEAVQIDTSVSKSYDSHITFLGGLNAWQPLGTAALAGEKVTIYVGAPGKTQGDSTPLKLVATQYHSESSPFYKYASDLKVGVNEIIIPKISSIDCEQGGALYVEYTGRNINDSYAVRVSGGSPYPVLDLTKAENEDERAQLIETYFTEMEERVKELEALHNADPDSETSHRHISGKEYDEKNCILGATDIVLDQMMYSVAIKPLYDELTKRSDKKEDAVQQLTDSLNAMDAMIDLYYQHKGLSDNPVMDGVTYGKDRTPTSRLNIRYQRMFAGAFMYAGGLHIGIEWGSVPALGGSKPIETDENGKALENQDGQYFGWGISHEIGHIINEGAYAYAETTNNYYPQLAKSRDSNDTTRFSYEDVYKKVTSGTKGGGSERLAMYWQLHMAYDNGGYNFKTYDNYKDQRENLIFARIDSYARDTSRAPAPGGIKLTLDNADKDNKMIRLACAAAEKDLRDFFIRWGLTPDKTTDEYAGQFDEETRAIYYENDDSRVYRLEGGESIAESVTVKAEAEKDSQASNQVHLTMSLSDEGKRDQLLGYEITRIERRYGKEERRVVGFTTSDTFTDHVMTTNNRVVSYEVRGIDQCMNPTETYRISDEFKLLHEGMLDKTDWEITVNTTSPSDEKPDNEDETDTPCSGTISAAGMMIDNQLDQAYVGTTTEKEAEAVISLGKTESIAGFKYTYDGENPVKNYRLSISQDGEKWTEIKSGTFEFQEGSSSALIYFDLKDDPRYHVYETAYLKITAAGSKSFAAAELDILGPTGDNVELAEAGIGILKEDFYLTDAGSGETGEETADKIPAGSVIFTGKYKGNPAYNTFILYDEDGNVVGGRDADGAVTAHQLIFAPDPVNGQLGEITDGIWVYYIEPDELDGVTLPGKVRAEMYRVDNAETNEGDRLVSDTLFVELPKNLPDIEIKP